ncbi:PRKR-interacting protein 1 isoform 1-T1 [Dama dama]
MASSAASSVRPPRPKKEPQALIIPKNAAEEQKLKLERLMKNPDKAVPIPEKMSEWAPRPPPEFVRDVMGSSAGAGSGEFHVYRHLRRREYQRQDYMDAMAEKQKLDAEFQKRLERNKIAAEEQTAKRRKKRQKLKEKKLLAKKMKLEQKKQNEVIYGCESWTVKKAERQRIDAFELWCWRRLSRVPWTARRSNQSILKEMSPGCSLEGLMLKLKRQYFGHLMRRVDSLEKTLMLGGVGGRRRRG